MDGVVGERGTIPNDGVQESFQLVDVIRIVVAKLDVEGRLVVGVRLCPRNA